MKLSFGQQVISPGALAALTAGDERGPLPVTRVEIGGALDHEYCTPERSGCNAGRQSPLHLSIPSGEHASGSSRKRTARSGRPCLQESTNPVFRARFLRGNRSVRRPTAVIPQFCRLAVPPRKTAEPNAHEGSLVKSAPTPPLGRYGCTIKRRMLGTSSESNTTA